MVTNLQSRPAHPLGTLRTPLWLVRQLVSFETFFLLFLYGIQIRQILPPIPANEAIVFGAITMAMGGWIILRDGLYLRGVPILLAGLAFTGWMILSIGWTPSRIIVWENLRFLLTVNLWALFAGACIIAGSRERVVRLLVMIMLLALLLAVYRHLYRGRLRQLPLLPLSRRRGRLGRPDAYIAWGYIVSSGAAVALALAIFSKLRQPEAARRPRRLGVCGYFLLIAARSWSAARRRPAAHWSPLSSSPAYRRNRIEFAQTQLIGIGIVAIGLVYVGYLYATGQTTGATPTAF